MTTKRFFQVMMAFFMVFTLASPALTGQPTEQIKKTTDRIIAILSDPALKAPEMEKERRRMIREAVDERFDWGEFSRRALARHWRKRTAEERKAFIPLFGKLLERTYMDKVENYSGEKVHYVDEVTKGGYGLVKVKILTKKNQEIAVHYRLKKKGNGWFVYDVVVEGVSLVNNYRVQFNNIIRRSSYQELVERLKKKVAEQ